MKFDLFPDMGEEIIQRLNETYQGIIRMKEKLAEKEKRILELEVKLKEFNQNGR